MLFSVLIHIDIYLYIYIYFDIFLPLNSSHNYTYNECSKLVDCQEEMKTSQRLLVKSIEIVNITAEVNEQKYKVRNV